MAKKQKGKGGAKKRGRQVRKNLRKNSPISLYAKGLISGEQYFKLTKTKAPKGL